MITDSRYSLNEGTLPITPVEDRSVNILTLERAEGAFVHLIVSRDSLLPGEDLDACVNRQLKALARQTQGFKELSRQPVEIGPAVIPGLLLETQFKQQGQQIYQCQAIVQFSDGKQLIFTLNNPAPIDDRLREQWRALLAGFVPAGMPVPSGD